MQFLLKKVYDQKNKLCDNILKGLPGNEQGYSLEAFREILKTYNKLKKSIEGINIRGKLKTSENPEISCKNDI